MITQNLLALEVKSYITKSPFRAFSNDFRALVIVYYIVKM